MLTNRLVSPNAILVDVNSDSKRAKDALVTESVYLYYYLRVSHTCRTICGESITR